MALTKIASYISRIAALIIAACMTVFVGMLMAMLAKGALAPADVIGTADSVVKLIRLLFNAETVAVGAIVGITLSTIIVVVIIGSILWALKLIPRWFERSTIGYVLWLVVAALIWGGVSLGIWFAIWKTPQAVFLGAFGIVMAALMIYAIVNLTVAVFGVKSEWFRFVAFFAGVIWILACALLLSSDTPAVVFPVVGHLRGVNSTESEEILSHSIRILLLAVGCVFLLSQIVEERELLGLVFKQMRQRALSTCMTTILVMLAVGLAISVMIIRRESQSLFGQSDFGYEAILGPPKASDMQLVFNTVYLIEKSPGNIPYRLWLDMDDPRHFEKYEGDVLYYRSSKKGGTSEQTVTIVKEKTNDATPTRISVVGRNSTKEITPDKINEDIQPGEFIEVIGNAQGQALQITAMEVDPKWQQNVRWAIPFMVGDTYQGRGDRRIVGTSPQMFGYFDDGALIPSNEDSHPFEYRVGREFELAESTDKDKNGKLIQPRMFAPRKFEAVLGSECAAKDGFHLYDNNLTEDENYKRHAVFQATHGMPAPNEIPDIHKPKWHVVGFLKQSHTAYDRALFVPVISLYGIEEHEIGMIAQKLLQKGFNPNSIPAEQSVEIFKKAGIETDDLDPGTRKHFHLPPKTGPETQPAAAPAAGGELMHETKPPPATAPADDEDPDAYTLDKNGNIIPELPEAAWEISAILIKTRGSFAASTFLYNMQFGGNAEAIAANPAQVMRGFFDTFLKPTTLVMLGLSLLVTIVAAGSILVGIYNSVAARMREIAILRALGATRQRVLTLICLEAGLIGFFGGICGLILGHLLGAVGSIITNDQIGETINWIKVGWRIDFNKTGWPFVDDLVANEPLYLVLVILIAVVAGLVPALKAYSTPVATNLTAG